MMLNLCWSWNVCCHCTVIVELCCSECPDRPCVLACVRMQEHKGHVQGSHYSHTANESRAEQRTTNSKLPMKPVWTLCSPAKKTNLSFATSLSPRRGSVMPPYTPQIFGKTVSIPDPRLPVCWGAPTTPVYPHAFLPLWPPLLLSLRLPSPLLKATTVCHLGRRARWQTVVADWQTKFLLFSMRGLRIHLPLMWYKGSIIGLSNPIIVMRAHFRGYHVLLNDYIQ